jgi:hypothetical protein
MNDAERPEYITCIAETHAERVGRSWCGRDVRHEFHFIDIDHAAYNAQNEGRLLTCPECAQKVIELLSITE